MRKQPAHYSDDMFRPALEIDAGLITLASAGAMVAANPDMATTLTIQSGCALGLVALAVHSAIKGIPLLLKQSRMVRSKVARKTLKQLRELNAKPSHDGEAQLYVGEAYAWNVEVARAADERIKTSSKISDLQSPILKPLFRRWEREGRKMGGECWLAGLDIHRSLLLPESVLTGHVLLTGGVGMGKTTLMRILSLGSLHKGDTLIIGDPKNDKDWKDQLEAECKRLGKPFYYFNPANASKSCRIDLLRNWNRHYEVADRLSGLMADSKGSNPFVDFGGKVINQVVTAMIYVGKRPQIANIALSLTSATHDLCIRAIEQYLRDNLGERWSQDHTIRRNPKLKSGGHIELYQDLVSRGYERCDAVEGIVEICTHDRDHMSKMTASLLPLFNALNSGSLRDLLSPRDDGTDDDSRPIVSIKDVMSTGGVLYMAMDSLSDVKTAGYLSKLICADISACAGDRYNYGLEDAGQVTVLFDEIHAAIEGNEALLSFLAQSRAARFTMIMATQNLADLSAKVGEEVTKRFLGLTNSFITFRSTDPDTQDYTTKQFRKAYLSTTHYQQGHSSSEGGSMTDFADGYAERTQYVKDDALDPGLVGMLPKLHFFGRFSDGQVVKGQIPILEAA